MSTNLMRIGEKACKEPNLVFTTLYHHVTDVDNLRACYDALSADKALGVDGVSKEQYGKDLAQNFEDLSSRLKDIWNSDIRIKRETVLPKKIPRARIRNFQLTAVLCIWRRPVPG